MLLEFVCLIVGMMVGATWYSNYIEDRYQRTLEQIDSDLRKELEYTKNLNASLQQDVVFLREKLKRTQ